MSGLTCMAITGNGAAGLSAAAVAGYRQRHCRAIGDGGAGLSAAAIPGTVGDVSSGKCH